MAVFIYFFTVIFVIELFRFYYSYIVFGIFMAAWFNVLFNFYYSCHYSCIVFVSFYKACESIVLGRHGKTGGSGRVNQVCGSRVKTGQSSCGLGWVGPYFSEKFFDFYFLFNYKNKSMTTCLERMNKIN